jgi:hypothetical protein
MRGTVVLTAICLTMRASFRRAARCSAVPSSVPAVRTMPSPEVDTTKAPDLVSEAFDPEVNTLLVRALRIARFARTRDYRNVIHPS